MIRFKTPASSAGMSPRTAQRSEHRRAPRPLHVISERLFRDALVRERKRADRFDEAFTVLLIAFDRDRLTTTAVTSLAESLSQAPATADVIGWFQQDSVLGLMRSAATGEAATAAAGLTSAAQVAMARSLPPDLISSCAIRCETYPCRNDAIAPGIVYAGLERRSPQRLAQMAAKRALDIAGSAACLVAFGPVLLCVAAAVKLTSKGPVFFRQQRIGEAGEPFTMFKFRTMQVNADPRIHQEYVEKFIQSNQSATTGKDAVFKLVNDPRVTSIGDFLRRTSLDEFPQFWNVLRGDMSLVGPRPPLPYEVARYKQWHRRRVLEAKPGITGLWQVTGRSRTTFDEMVRLDLRYARTRSVWNDLNILLATPKAVLSGKGAR
jgi:lipopolysaccharide/colanic/teichoic acid biosynthesis glycosyltransferase